MKLVIPGISRILRFEENVVNSLVIENGPMYRKLVEDITLQCDGYDNAGDGVVMSVKDKPVEMKKYAEIICDFVPFEINRKQILTHINNQLEKVAVNEQFFVKSQELLNEISQFIGEISFNLPCGINCEKLSVSGIIKSAGVVIDTDTRDTLELLLEYMRLICEFEREKLFVTVNLRSFFDDDSMSEFLKCVCLNKHKLLMLECCERPLLNHEQRIIIDKDLCEI